MKILTKKNGIALIAVLTVLLVLTLLLPAMYSMANRAVISAAKGMDEQRASYLARTTLEMAVAAFQDFYDTYDEENTKYKAAAASDSSVQKPVVCSNYENFVAKGKMDSSTVYMYIKDGIEIPQREDYATDNEYNAAWDTYQGEAVKYTIESGDIAGYTFLGYADCDIAYTEESEYYKIQNGKTELLKDDYQTDGEGNFILDSQGKKVVTVSAEKKYQDIIDALKTAIKNGSDTSSMAQCHKVDRKQVRFDATATIGSKTYRDFSRGCTVILPTKPSDENWIVPASIESNQIFVDSSNATGVMTLDYSDIFMGTESDTKATSQVVYSFSCTGNMVITSKGMTIKDGDSYVDYNTYIKEHESEGYTNQLSDFSLGVYPITKTIKPENDPSFYCLKTNNMKSWASGAQKDNFILFSATNGIQVEMPVNLLINPCRTGRIGDGLSRNQSLYKVLAFQSPNIVFKESVNNFVSLWKKTGLVEGVLDIFGDGYDARRVSTVILSAPSNTPYSYLNGDRNQICKAGKVFFGEDAYVWVIPFSENGSNYKTQTVYYKNSDIRLYKIASKGDVYYFNAEVPTKNGKQTTGFSMTGYFMDVLYKDMVGESDYGWKLWSKLKDNAFGFAQSTLMPAEYVKSDFEKIGNIYEGTGGRLPVIDDFYVVWDS